MQLTAEQLIQSPFDERPIAQTFFNEEGKLVRWNKCAQRMIGQAMNVDMADLRLDMLMSDRLKAAAQERHPGNDVLVFDNKTHKISNNYQFTSLHEHTSIFIEYMPVLSLETGENWHYLMLKDISEMHRGQMQAEANARKLHDIAKYLSIAHINFMPDTMTMDLSGGRDNYNVMGMPIEAAYGKMVHPDDLEKALRFFRKAKEELKSTKRTIFRIYSQTMKEFRHFQFTLYPVTSATGVFMGYTGFAMDYTDQLHDLTERHRNAGNRIKSLKEEVDNVVKEKSQMEHMLSVMGHDLRSPLATIMSFAEMIVDSDNIDERRECYNYMRMSADQMSLLINDLLESTRLDSGTVRYNMMSCSAAEIVRATFASHRVIYRDLPCELILNEGAEDVTINADYQRVTEILNNYLSNAAKYTQEGSVTISWEAGDGGCYIHVRDTGRGIAPVNCERVFDRYEMLGSDVPGTGLGLYICRQLALGMGGRTGCISQLGEGADFWLWLPQV